MPQISGCVVLNLPNKLSSPYAGSLSRILISTGHITLGFGLLSVYFDIFPILGVAAALPFFLIEMQRAKELSKDALSFSFKRVALHVVCIFAVIFAASFFPDQKIQMQFWTALIAILLPLSIYDAFMLRQGQCGLQLYRPLKLGLKRRYGRKK